ncbi:M28 family peptidase [bacterium]|nr:M28 family peptidase [bacterium]
MIAVILIVLGCIVFPMPGKSFRGPLPALTADQQALSGALERHVRVLAEEIGERSMDRFDRLELAADYVSAQFAATGIQPKSLSYNLEGHQPRNIELEFPGGANAGEIIVVGAHYDSELGTPGANDNASGVAATIELARILKDKPRDRTIRLVAFVNEEPPWFQTDVMGSMVYAKECRKNGDRIVGMLSLETIGYYSDAEGSQNYPLPALGKIYPSRGNFIGFVGNIGSRELVRNCVGAFRANAQFPCEGIAAPEALDIGLSDHWSFWQAGYQALMITDTAPYRYPHYHSAQDTPDKIDYDRMARVVAGVASVVEDLSKAKRTGTGE